MKKAIVLVFCLFIGTGSTFAGDAVRLEIGKRLIDEASGETISVPKIDLIIPRGGEREIFLPPYTLNIRAGSAIDGKYQIGIGLFGLGPTFQKFNYDFALEVGEKMVIPSLPGKSTTIVDYSLIIADDTTSFFGDIIDKTDTTAWISALTIHYNSHMMRGSLADFNWETKMGYLENIYNRFRESYRLSLFEKIDLNLYPALTNRVYLDGNRHYAISPVSDRIDIVYGHDIDAASPAPAAELLLYKLWGYGPRWMVTGMARFYNDNNLKLRRYAKNLDPKIISEKLGDITWIESDSGMVYCGSFANWLLNEYSQSSFQKLYRESTPLNYERRFEENYGISLEKAIAKHIEFLSKYAPLEGEVEYFASIYLRDNNYSRAGDLYEELTQEDSDRREEFLMNLAACRFWQGDYEKSAETYQKLIDDFGNNPRYIMLLGDSELALGNSDKAKSLYSEAFDKYDYGEAGLRLVAMLIETGDIKRSRSLFDRLSGDIKNMYDYHLELARLELAEGKTPDDTLLLQTAYRALGGITQTPGDPRIYFTAGRSYLLAGNFDAAEENLQMAYFLETKANALAQSLLELGRTFDLQGNREKALEYYSKARKIGGAFIKSLCDKYQNKRFDWKG